MIRKILQLRGDGEVIERVALERALPGRTGRHGERNDLALVPEHLRRRVDEVDLRASPHIEQLEEPTIQFISTNGAVEGEFQLRVRSDLGGAVSWEHREKTRRRGVERYGRGGDDTAAVGKGDTLHRADGEVVR